MRGWMVSQSLDNFKSGNDFGDYYSKIKELTGGYGDSDTQSVAYNDVTVED